MTYTAVPALDVGMAALVGERAVDDVVFPSAEGTPLRNTNWRRRVFDPAVKLAGLEPMRIHDLRLDEIDTLYAKGAGTEDITAVVNAGYKRGATVPRCVGQGTEIEVVELSAYAPMALAGLHTNVPEALRTRSVHFRMRKRKPSERLERYQRRRVEAQAEPFRVALEA